MGEFLKKETEDGKPVKDTRSSLFEKMAKKRSNWNFNLRYSETSGGPFR